MSFGQSRAGAIAVEAVQCIKDEHEVQQAVQLSSAAGCVSSYC